MTFNLICCFACFKRFTQYLHFDFITLSVAIYFVYFQFRLQLNFAVLSIYYWDSFVSLYRTQPQPHIHTFGFSLCVGAQVFDSQNWKAAITLHSFSVHIHSALDVRALPFRLMVFAILTCTRCLLLSFFLSRSLPSLRSVLVQISCKNWVKLKGNSRASQCNSG